MKSKIVGLIFFLIFCILLSATALSKVYVEKSKCVSCQDCINTCPVKAITIENNKACIDMSKCIRCNLCVKACTFNAIKVSK